MFSMPAASSNEVAGVSPAIEEMECDLFLADCANQLDQLLISFL